MRREIFGEDHDAFRDQFRRFVAAEIEPHVLDWNSAGITPRSIWKRMGEEGYFGCDMPEEWGGMGLGHLELAMVSAEAARARYGPFAINCQAPDEGNMHTIEKWGNPELAVIYLICFVSLMLLGGGRFCLDRVLFKRKK